MKRPLRRSFFRILSFPKNQLSLERLDERGIVKDDPSWWCFTDWHEQLNKQAPAQAVLTYCMKRGLPLAERLGDTEAADGGTPSKDFS